MVYHKENGTQVQKDEQELQAIIACQKGVSEAYRYLVEKYQSRAYYGALIYTHNRDDALDLSQEAFYRAYKAIKRFDPDKYFYTWFYKILKNICLNYVRFREVRQQNRQSMGDEKNFIDPGSTEQPDELFEKSEQTQIIWQAIQGLDEKSWEIILLKEFNDMSYQEIAEVLDIPLGSVMSRLYYARRKLLKELEWLND